MALIEITNGIVEYPKFTSSDFSFRKKLFQKKKEIEHKRSLSNINLTFKEGERVGLIGHNGAGKTTFLKLVSGLITLNSGKIISKTKTLALLDLQAGLYEDLNAYQNIKILHMIHNSGYELRDEDIESILEFSELKEKADDLISSYSSGMRLRLCFAVLTHLQPDTLVMDEWLSVGDEYFIKKSKDRLKHYLKFTKLFFLASHNKSIIHELCNRILEFKNGCVINDNKI